MCSARSVFDDQGPSYLASVPPIPDSFVKMITAEFDLDGSQYIADLGCGSGSLALALSSFGICTIGIDISTKMIHLARDADKEKRVTWIRCAAQDYDFGNSCFNLVIAYEAFHLFDKLELMLPRLERGLAPGGVLCVGWTTYEWEQELYASIVDVSRAFDVNWDDWGYWRCPNLARDLLIHASSLSPLLTRSIRVESTTSVATIARFLGSIDRTSQLSEKDRGRYVDSLASRFVGVLHGEWSCGETEYMIAYCSKLD